MKNYAQCTRDNTANEPLKPEGFIDKYTQYLIREYRIKTETRLLDVGCGNNEYCEAWEKIGIHTDGVDKYAVDHQFYADVEKELPFPDNHFDVVHSKSLVEHLRIIDNAIIEMHRVLRSGGICIMLTPDINVAKWLFWGDIGHFTPFNANKLYQLFDYADFKNIDVGHFYKGIFDKRWKRPLRGMLIGVGIK